MPLVRQCPPHLFQMVNIDLQCIISLPIVLNLLPHTRCQMPCHNTTMSVKRIWLGEPKSYVDNQSPILKTQSDSSICTTLEIIYIIIVSINVCHKHEQDIEPLECHHRIYSCIKFNHIQLLFLIFREICLLNHVVLFL